MMNDIQGITSAFQTVNTQLEAVTEKKSAAVQARQDLSNLPDDVLGQLNGQPIVFARLLTTLLQELDPALQSVLVTLSLGKSTWCLTQPIWDVFLVPKPLC